jgi:hypothetical protein
MPPARVPAALRLVAATRGPAAGLGRQFHATARAPVSVGDRLPDVELMETSPGNKVNLARELARGKATIIGVPAAFSESFSFPPFPSPQCVTLLTMLPRKAPPAPSRTSPATFPRRTSNPPGASLSSP